MHIPKRNQKSLTIPIPNTAPPPCANKDKIWASSIVIKALKLFVVDLRKVQAGSKRCQWLIASKIDKANNLHQMDCIFGDVAKQENISPIKLQVPNVQKLVLRYHRGNLLLIQIANKLTNVVSLELEGFRRPK